MQEPTCSHPTCHRPRWARGYCASHYSAWYRRHHGRASRTRYSVTCVVCGQPFTALIRTARYCTTGPDSCEAAAKRRGNPLRKIGGPLADPHREPTAREIASYKRAVRRDPCAYCGAAIGGTLDHIQPRADGNDNWMNMTSSCKRCNGIKHTVPLLLALLWVPAAREYHDLRRVLYPRQGVRGDH